MSNVGRAAGRFLCFLLAVSAAPVFAAGPTVFNNARHDTSRPLTQLAARGRLPSQQPDREMTEPRATRGALASGRSDDVARPLNSPLAGVSTAINFDGQSANDNRRIFGFAFVPPDTNGAVGASQYVQMVNVTIAVYSKSATLQLGPAPIHSLWDGFGGLCENGGETVGFSDGGDPIVLYDHLADRWLVSQLQFDETFTNTAQCVAISTSSDATGSYNRYEFDFGANFPDYPKFGIWPDAYYNSINVFPGLKKFAGAQACAFDRSAMLAGQAAQAICFQQPPSVSSLLPADLDGSTLPPSGAPNYFVGIADAMHLNLFRFHADFTNPDASTFSGPVSISVAPFDEICGLNSRSCIAEPEPGEKVDGLSDRVMFRLAYRNFGDHETLLANHTVKGGALGGVRWYEIRNPGSTPAVFQQGTIVDPDIDFWLGSIAMDRVGNIAVGFSAMGKRDFSSVYVAGRKPSDSLGSMAGPLILAFGSGVQVNSFKRWGDYSSMTLDPKDDCTFWFTQEYYVATGARNWATRVGAFKFDSCPAGK